jgi:arginase family enzyme
VLVHVDLDVIDPAHGRANQYAAPGGLSPAEVLRVIELARQRFTLAALVVASYDPSVDEDGRVAEIGAEIVRAVA